ncbi:M23 family metallopeptidase [Helicobacter sp. MIT 14-3879]|uniref:M23 family metallopeptidase n=1 Tax=Helicobacter sp. MIT 14-3879 TaxID=2040649 RepID=UPI000E1F81D6|nr:M23 family metallopeptidase [Helicobacter sp. MIT 14-3879]RDU60872.1 M23 family peptidase [Helicobacter sp. MIT 14-3879]
MEQKDKLMITIVDENGSKQFTMTKVMQKVIAYAGVILLCLIIGGYFIMNSITQQLENMKIAKQDAFSQFQSIHEQNLFLQDDIESKSQELLVIKEKLNDLENMMEMRNYNNEKTSSQDLDLDKLESTQKATILQVIPNGNPLELFEMKQKTKRKAYDSSLMTVGYSPLSNFVNMGYDYYTGNSQPVVATADGTVESIRDDNQKYGYGNLVRIVHALGFSTAYTNLDKVTVKKGDFISKGDIIGYTTASPGKNHISLYYEVRFLSEGLDTLSFIDWDEQNFGAIFESNQNANIDLKSLMWALNDILKLNDIYSHFAYTDINNLITESPKDLMTVTNYNTTPMINNAIRHIHHADRTKSSNAMLSPQENINNTAPNKTFSIQDSQLVNSFISDAKNSQDSSIN